jgi:branched-subunit amino acid transport protein
VVDANIWLAIVAVSLTGVLTRVSLLLLSEKIKLPERVERALRFAPAAALASITFPAVLMPQGHWQSGFNPTLWAAVVTALIMAWRKNMVIALVVGVLVFCALRFWL